MSDLIQIGVGILPDKVFNNNDNNIVIIDLRSREEFDAGHFKGAISINLSNSEWQQIFTCKNKSYELDYKLYKQTKVLTKRYLGTPIIIYDKDTEFLNTEYIEKDSSQIHWISKIFALESWTNWNFIIGGYDSIKILCDSSIVSSEFTDLTFNMLPKINGFDNNDDLDESEESEESDDFDDCRTPENMDPPLSFFLDNRFMAICSEITACNPEIIKNEKITHILNLTKTDSPECIKKIAITMNIPINDSGNQNILIWLCQAIKFIHDARSVPNNRILIHCHAGISRSTSFAIAYLMWAEQKTLDNACKLVTKHRQVCAPNMNFMGQLTVFKKFLKPNTNIKDLPKIISYATQYLFQE